jgi:hypothetical protein
MGRVPSLGTRGWVRQAVTGGIVAGVAGSITLALVRLLLGTTFFWIVTRIVGSAERYPARMARGLIWATLKLPAFPFVGERALTPGFDAGVVLLGMLNHLALSIVWGILFGLVAHGRTRGATLALGVIWGALMWLVNYNILLPLLGAGVLGGRPGVLVQFIPYGLAMAIAFLLWQRRQHRLAAA